MATEGLQGVPATATCADGCACGALAPPAPRPIPERERRPRRRAWGLTALTNIRNSLEAVIAIPSGLLAGSIALVGFSLDSVVEVSSAVVIAWRLARQSATDHAANERAEKREVRLIAVSFFAIAAYVTYDALAKLLGIGEEPERSPVAWRSWRSRSS